MAAFHNPNLAILELVARALGPDRRPELLFECRATASELRAYLAVEFIALFADPDFETALSGHLPGDAFSQQRVKATLKNPLIFAASSRCVSPSDFSRVQKSFLGG